jgi:RNA polymerase sigma-70 factor, ECF subfamily
VVRLFNGREIVVPDSGVPADESAPSPDLRLAERVASGDRQAFRILMRRFHGLLYRTARSIVTDDAEAEDVLQNAYLLAYRKISEFRGDANLSTWLVRIVVNEALACARKRGQPLHVVTMDTEALNDEVII